MTKKVLMCLMALLMAASFAMAGCGAQGTEPDENGIATGGDQTIEENANLKDIDISKDGDAEKVVLSFINGSRSAGIEEGRISAVPQYEAELLSNPYRLKIEIGAVSFWDYKAKSNWSSSTLVTGIFKTMPVAEQPFTLYIQLSDNVNYTISEQDDTLSIRLEPKNDHASAAKQYVVLNAFAELEEGLIPEDLGLTPVLCEGYTQTVLISQGFDTVEEAEEYKGKVETAIANTMTPKTVSIVQLQDNAAPVLASDDNSVIAAEKTVLLKDGQEQTLPVVMQNGRYLCASSEYGVFARTMQPDLSMDVENVTLDQLWTVNNEGKKTQMDLPEFYGVLQAEFSSDGRYLAILDADTDSSILYLYDSENGAITNLGEEGFGNSTSCFAWDESENVIYAVTGFNNQQMMKYDVEGGEEKVSTIEERSCSATSMALYGNTIYFAESDEENANYTVYALDIRTGVRTPVTTGMDCKISHDGKYLLVLENEQLEEEVVAFRIKIWNLETQEETTIAEQAYVENYTFDAEKNVIYYTVSDEAKQDTNYPYTLYKYDIEVGKASTLGDLTTSSIVASNTQGTLYVIDYFEVENDEIEVTYQLQDQ